MTSKTPMFDLHIHTPFSDGQVPFDVLIEMLIDEGIKIAGLADHVNPVSIYLQPCERLSWLKCRNNNRKILVFNYTARILKYRKRYIRYLDRKYKRIRLLVGGELDTVLPNGNLTLPRGITPDHFDYLLVSKHHNLPGRPLDFLYKKFPKFERWMLRHNPRMLLNRETWEMGLYNMFRRFRPDIFAHPQIGMPHNIGHLRDKYRMKRLVLMCKKYDVAIELNDLVKGPGKRDGPIRWFEPILEYAHEYGVKVSLASDFHGFNPERWREQIRGAFRMLELAEEYDLELINPENFLPENRRRNRDRANLGGCNKIK